MKIGVYSGTFDPFHIGHEWVVADALDRFDIDKLLLEVEETPRRKKPVAELYHRVNISKIALTSRQSVLVNSLGLSEGHTMDDTIDKIRSKYGEDVEVIIIMGGDVFEFVPSWKDIDKYKSAISFAVYLRSEDDGEIAVSIVQGSDSGIKATLVQSQHHKVSSTLVRRSLPEQLKDLVDPKVATYIEENKLYE